MNLLMIAIAWLLAFPLAIASSNTSGYECSVAHSTLETTQNTHTLNVSQASLQVRSVNAIGAGYRQRWPLTDESAPGQLRVINYCFTTLEVRAQTWCQLQNAIKVWQDALGGPASPQAGHNLAFRETAFVDGSPAPCYTNWDANTQTGNWNQYILSGTLVIVGSDQPNFRATLGFEPTNVNGRHTLTIRKTLTPNANDIQAIAHEIGHVIGMVHEHQRYDRDLYVEFKCDKQRDFDRALHDARAAGYSDEEARRRLCEDPDFAEHFNLFSTREFTKGIHVPGQDQIQIAYDTPFDYDSIMMYASFVFADFETCEADLLSCTLLRVEWANGVKVALHWIDRNFVPSAGDVAFVRRYYPWVGWTGNHGSAKAGKRSNLATSGSANTTILNQQRKADGSTSYMYRVRKEV